MDRIESIQKGLVDGVRVSNLVCQIHGTPMVEFTEPKRIGGEDNSRVLDPFCLECTQEEITKYSNQKLEENLNAERFIHTYNVLARDSTIPKEFSEASFENFLVKTDEERALKEFAENQVQKYLDGMEGNTLITGGTGIGKSHLCLAMARAINEGYKEKGEPVSVLFVSLTEIIAKIKGGWNYNGGATLPEHEAIEILVRPDYLVLDDLGAKNAEIRPKSDWEQDLLFSVLDKRTKTIINTNLTGKELQTVYNSRNYSRILKGLDGNTFKAEGIPDKRFRLLRMKEELAKAQSRKPP
ncbi:ATP-binding protein [Streptococcus sp. NLN64]|uniref:ATP-binding protein n=1 Tax=Streptococcus sp. NLN64 TaxID=2822799 RepID=UPI0032B5ED90